MALQNGALTHPPAHGWTSSSLQPPGGCQDAVVHPFLKWAGGKRWFVQSLAGLLPSTYRRYIEPFLGSAAVFFHMKPAAALLSDSNPDLMNAYAVVREAPIKIAQLLNIHHSRHGPAYYYRMRSTHFSCPIERAACFIYLNRTCWNGLYRVNRQGAFNVPIGTKPSVLLPTDNFPAVSALLARAFLEVADFAQIIARPESGDFIFADPPYTVRHSHNGFIKYNERLFLGRINFGSTTPSRKRFTEVPTLS